MASRKGIGRGENIRCHTTIRWSTARQGHAHGALQRDGEVLQGAVRPGTHPGPLGLGGRGHARLQAVGHVHAGRAAMAAMGEHTRLRETRLFFQAASEDEIRDLVERIASPARRRRAGASSAPPGAGALSSRPLSTSRKRYASEAATRAAADRGPHHHRDQRGAARRPVGDRDLPREQVGPLRPGPAPDHRGHRERAGRAGALIGPPPQQDQRRDPAAAEAITRARPSPVSPL